MGTEEDATSEVVAVARLKLPAAPGARPGSESWHATGGRDRLIPGLESASRIRFTSRTHHNPMLLFQ
jgi:hypothetical protein